VAILRNHGGRRLRIGMFRSLLFGAVVTIAACATPVPSPSLRSEGPIPTALATDSARSIAPPTEAALPFELTCGPMDAFACDGLATQIASDLAREYPEKRIVSMALSGPDNGYTALFDDGTAVVVTID